MVRFYYFLCRCLTVRDTNQVYCAYAEWLSEHLKEDAFDFSGKKPKLLKKPKFSIHDFQAGRVNKECYELYFTRFLPCLEKMTVWNRKLKKAKKIKIFSPLVVRHFGCS